MKLLIDIQGCQTNSQYRGIGRYSFQIVKAILENKEDHTIILFANGNFKDSLYKLRSEFLKYIPDENFIVFNAEFPVAEINNENSVRCRLAEIYREKLISTIKPDAVLITSLFEGFEDNAVTSIGRTGSKPFTAVILYDLIPYLYPDPNWPPEYHSYYDKKIQSFKHADLLLSISDYSKLEATNVFPELTNRITNISSACDGRFFPEALKNDRRKKLLQQYGIRGKFLMSVGANEPRKNFEAILYSFSSLPTNLKQERQIVIVGEGNKQIQQKIKDIAEQKGLKENQVIFTGHISDEDLIDLYRLCELYVFASKYEGFGLPALEAMSCGAPVIGSRATSVPEVIGRSDALFDPESIDELSHLIKRALTDYEFFASLKDYAIRRAKEFSWQKTASRAIEAISENYKSENSYDIVFKKNKYNKLPKLALHSPLPPEETGIADYVAELLPSLAKYYEITVISDQKEILPGPNGEYFNVRPVSWFESNFSFFNRIVYQVGNSPFHAHMLNLINVYPGLVILHDFFLSNLISWMEVSGYELNAFKRALFNGHGYQALNSLEEEGFDNAKIKWPCSFEVIQASLGLIVHSEYSKGLITRYFGEQFSEKISITKHHRLLPNNIDRRSARSQLGINDNSFIVCAFGFMDPTKLNHRLITAWGLSALSSNVDCHLIFVGGKAPQDYALKCDNMISKVNGGNRVKITGFVSRKQFEAYLSAADFAIQLRTLSRGETSGTVLDCMAYGLPLIINSHGSMQEIPNDVVIKLDDEFNDKDLVLAMDRLYREPSLRKVMSQHGKLYISQSHSPEKTASDYAEAIEKTFETNHNISIINKSIEFWSMIPPLTSHDRSIVSQKLADMIRIERRRFIYLDISATAKNDLKTGIERVTRSLLKELLLNPPTGFHVVPVYLTNELGAWGFRSANQYLSSKDVFTLAQMKDEVVLPGFGDILLALDIYAEGVIPAEKEGIYNFWKASGAKIGFLVYDILPITHPLFFPPWTKNIHESWLNSISRSSKFLICISNHVKSEVLNWFEKTGIPSEKRPELIVSYLGADIESSFPSKGLPQDSDFIFKQIHKRPSFLMVGTVEPRKGYLQTLDVFKKLWAKGYDANLVIVGKEGWKPIPEHERRTIPQIIQTIRNCSEINNRLFWLENDISDEYLEKIYLSCSYLIAASEDEGFGLPIIEAIKNGLKVLARDIPVFREIAGNSIEYFNSHGSNSLEEKLSFIIRNNNFNIDGREQKKYSWMTWKESASILINKILTI